MHRLQEEKFDAGFAENIDNCGYGGSFFDFDAFEKLLFINNIKTSDKIVLKNDSSPALFHLLDIRKYATAFSMAFMDGHYLVTQIPASTAYVPC